MGSRLSLTHSAPPISAIALTTWNNFLEQLFEFFASAAVPFLYYRVMSKTSFETGPLAIFSMKVCRGMASLTPHITPTLTSILYPEQGRPGHTAAAVSYTHLTLPTKA